MCERCTIIECAFGSREPLPPSIASLDVGRTFTSTPGCINALAAASAKEPIQTIKDAEGIAEHDDDDDPNLPGVSDEHTAMKHNNTIATPDLSGTPARCKPSLHEALATPELSGVKFPAVPRLSTRLHISHTKWSDLARLGSQKAPATAKRRNVSSRSVLGYIMGHAHILDALMLNCPDFSTLFALVTSCQTAKRAFEHHPAGIIKAMLQTMPQELQYLTTALIGINGCPIGHSRFIRRHMEIWLGMGPKPLTDRLQMSPIKILSKLARSFSAIDLFMKVIPKNCENNFSEYQKVLESRVGLNHVNLVDWTDNIPLLQQTEWSDVPDDTEWDVPGLPRPGSGPQATSLPLNDREEYRLKRALLRYELFCAIFYLGPEGHYDAQDHPHRFKPVPMFCKEHAFCKEQALFLENYVNPWEIGELAVVSHFMFDLVRNAFFYKYKALRYNEAYDSWYGRWGNRNHGRNRHDDHEEVVDEFDNYMVWYASQGLTLLRKIYNDRKLGYEALLDKYCEPRYRPAELFVPFEKCANRQGGDVNIPNASVTPRQTWLDTQGMELPSKGWLAKSSASDDWVDGDTYWGEKWMRKIGYYIWDRD